MVVAIWNLLPAMLKGNPGIDWRDAQFCEYGNSRMIRTAELYDLAKDPLETKTVFGDTEYAEDVRAMERRLNNFFQRHEGKEMSGVRLPNYLNTMAPSPGP